MKKQVQSAKCKVQSLRKDFPILNKKNSRKLTYLDSASTSLKPKQVIAAVTDFYEGYTANVHRGVYQESEEATAKFEETRQKVARFIGAETEEIIFTKSTTEGINLVAGGWGSWVKGQGSSGKKILVTMMEHHSNFLPWQKVSSKFKVQSSKLEVIDINEDGELELDDLDKKLKGVGMVAVAHVSNVLGTINPVADIVKKAHIAGALVLVDGAQAVGHMPVDVKKLGCDFYVFSGHKMLGPSGVGVLWMRKELADKMEPMLVGGGMVSKVSQGEVEYLDSPAKFEAGTPNIEGVIGLGAAVDYLEKVGVEKIRKHEAGLTEYALKKLSKIKGLTVYGNAKNMAGIIAYNLENIHPHDLASMLDNDGIAVRAGHHCCMPLHQRLGIMASVRVSFHLYNRKEDVDRLVEAIKKINFQFSVVSLPAGR